MPNQGRRQLCEIGGAKLKSGGQRFSPKCEGFFWPKSQIFRPKAGDLQKNKNKKKRSSPKSKGSFWPKSQIFRPKEKKKVFTEIRRLFLAEIANFNVFSAQKHQLLPPPKNTVGGQERNRGGKNENRGAMPPCWRRA